MEGPETALHKGLGAKTSCIFTSSMSRWGWYLMMYYGEPKLWYLYGKLLG